MDLLLDVESCIAIKAKTSRRNFWWSIKKTEGADVYLSEGLCIERMRASDGKIKKISHQPPNDSHHLRSFGVSRNGAQMCWFLSSGQVLSQCVGSKEVHRSALPGSIHEPSARTHLCRIFISDDAYTILLIHGQVIYLGTRNTDGKDGLLSRRYTWSTVAIGSSLDSKAGLSKEVVVDAVFLQEDQEQGARWRVLVVSSSDARQCTLLSRVVVGLGRAGRWGGRPAAPHSFRIGSSPVREGPCEWSRIALSVDSVCGPGGKVSKRKGSIILALSASTSLAAVAVNGTTTAGCKLLFVGSSDRAVCIQPVYPAMAPQTGRSWWIAAMQWSGDGLFLAAITRRGALLLFPRLSPPLLLSVGGCSADRGPSTHLVLHPLIGVETSKSHASTSQDCSSLSEPGHRRQVFSLATHPSQPRLLCSDGYMLTVLRIPECATTERLALRGVNAVLPVLCCPGADGEGRPDGASAEGHSEFASGSLEAFLHSAIYGRSSTTGALHIPDGFSSAVLNSSQRGWANQKDKHLFCVQLLCSSFALLLSSDRQILSLDSSTTNAVALTKSWVCACTALVKELFATNAPLLVAFWKMLVDLLSFDSSARHFVLSLYFLSPVVESLVDLSKSNTCVHSDRGVSQQEVRDCVNSLAVASRMVLEVMLAVRSAYGLTCTTSQPRPAALALPDSLLVCATGSLADYLQDILVLIEGSLSMTVQSGILKPLVSQLKSLQSKLASVSSCNIRIDPVDRVSPSLKALSLLHSKMLSLDFASALKLVDSLIEKFPSNKFQTPSLLPCSTFSQPGIASDLKGLEFYSYEPDFELVLSSLGSFMARYFLGKDLYIPLPGNPIPVPPLSFQSHQPLARLVRVGYESVNERTEGLQGSPGLSWSPSSALHILLLAGHWDEAAVFCRACGNESLSLALIVAYLHFRHLLSRYASQSSPLMSLQSVSDSIFSTAREVVLKFTEDLAQTAINRFQKSKEQDSLLVRSRSPVVESGSREQEIVCLLCRSLLACGPASVVWGLAARCLDAVYREVPALDLLAPGTCSCRCSLLGLTELPHGCSVHADKVCPEYGARLSVSKAVLQLLFVLMSSGQLAAVVTQYLAQVTAAFKTTSEKNIYSKVLAKCPDEGLCQYPDVAPEDQGTEDQGTEDQGSTAGCQDLCGLLRRCFLCLWYLYSRDQCSQLHHRSVQSYWQAQNSTSEETVVIWSIRLVEAARCLFPADSVRAAEDMALSVLADLPLCEHKARLLAVSFHQCDYESRIDALGDKFRRIMLQLRRTSDCCVSPSSEQEHPLSLAYVQAFTEMQLLKQAAESVDLGLGGVPSHPNLTELDGEYVAFAHSLGQEIRDMGFTAVGESTSVSLLLDQMARQGDVESGDAWQRMMPLARLASDQGATPPGKGQPQHNASAVSDTDLFVTPETILSSLLMAERRVAPEQQHLSRGPALPGSGHTKAQSDNFILLHAGFPTDNIKVKPTQLAPPPDRGEAVDGHAGSTDERCSRQLEQQAAATGEETASLLEETITLLSIGEILEPLSGLEETYTANLQGSFTVVTETDSTETTLEAAGNREDETTFDVTLTLSDGRSSLDESNRNGDRKSGLQDDGDCSEGDDDEGDDSDDDKPEGNKKQSHPNNVTLLSSTFSSPDADKTRGVVSFQSNEAKVTRPAVIGSKTSSGPLKSRGTSSVPTPSIAGPDSLQAKKRRKGPPQSSPELNPSAPDGTAHRDGSGAVWLRTVPERPAPRLTPPSPSERRHSAASPPPTPARVASGASVREPLNRPRREEPPPPPPPPPALAPAVPVGSSHCLSATVQTQSSTPSPALLEVQDLETPHSYQPAKHCSEVTEFSSSTQTSKSSSSRSSIMKKDNSLPYYHAPQNMNSFPGMANVQDAKSPSRVTFAQQSSVDSRDELAAAVAAKRKGHPEKDSSTSGSQQDMKRIARKEMRKMFHKVSNILKVTQEQWFQSLEANLSESSLSAPGHSALQQTHGAVSTQPSTTQPHSIHVEDLHSSRDVPHTNTPLSGPTSRRHPCTTLGPPSVRHPGSAQPTAANPPNAAPLSRRAALQPPSRLDLGERGGFNRSDTTNSPGVVYRLESPGSSSSTTAALTQQQQQQQWLGGSAQHSDSRPSMLWRGPLQSTMQNPGPNPPREMFPCSLLQLRLVEPSSLHPVHATPRVDPSPWPAAAPNPIASGVPHPRYPDNRVQAQGIPPPPLLSFPVQLSRGPALLTRQPPAFTPVTAMPTPQPHLPMLHVPQPPPESKEEFQLIPLSVAAPQTRHPALLRVNDPLEKESEKAPFRLLQLKDNSRPKPNGPATLWRGLEPHHQPENQHTFQLMKLPVHPPPPVQVQPRSADDQRPSQVSASLPTKPEQSQPLSSLPGHPHRSKDPTSGRTAAEVSVAVSPAATPDGRRLVATLSDSTTQVDPPHLASRKDIATQVDNVSDRKLVAPASLLSGHPNTLHLASSEDVHPSMASPHDSPAKRSLAGSPKAPAVGNAAIGTSLTGGNRQEEHRSAHTGRLVLTDREKDLPNVNATGIGRAEPNALQGIYRPSSLPLPQPGHRVQTPELSISTPVPTPLCSGHTPDHISASLVSAMSMGKKDRLDMKEYILVRDVTGDELSSDSDDGVGGDETPRTLTGIQDSELMAGETGVATSEAQPFAPLTGINLVVGDARKKQRFDDIHHRQADFTSEGGDDDEALSKLRRVEAQLNTLEVATRKVQQEIHLGSYKLLDLLVDQPGAPTGAPSRAADPVPDSATTSVGGSVNGHRRGGGIHHQSEVEAAPILDTLPQHLDTGKDYKGSAPGAPLSERNRSELREWMEKKRKENLKKYKQERRELLEKERKPFVPKESRVVVGPEQREAQRKQLEADFHEQRVQDAFALMADLVQTQRPHSARAPGKPKHPVPASPARLPRHPTLPGTGGHPGSTRSRPYSPKSTHPVGLSGTGGHPGSTSAELSVEEDRVDPFGPVFSSQDPTHHRLRPNSEQEMGGRTESNSGKHRKRPLKKIASVEGLTEAETEAVTRLLTAADDAGNTDSSVSVTSATVSEVDWTAVDLLLEQ